MATIKGTSNALGNLINKINSTAGPAPSGFSSGNIDIDDSIPTNMLTPEPVFKINYKLKGANANAKIWRICM